MTNSIYDSYLVLILPEVLSSRNILNHHIESFNYFISHQLPLIVKLHDKITCHADHKWYMKYIDVKVGKPEICDSSMDRRYTSPMECRIRNLTYSAPIYADIEFVVNKTTSIKRDIVIGYFPIMVRSKLCILNGKNPEEVSKLGECTLDPGGYFIINGAEKIIMIQEQMALNRISVFPSGGGTFTAICISFTAERKSRFEMLIKKQEIFIKHNTYSELIPFVVIMRCLGVTDVEIAALVGSEFMSTLLPSFQKAVEFGNKSKCLIWIHSKITRLDRFRFSGDVSPEDEAFEVLRITIMPHVESEASNMRRRAVMLAFMARRLLQVYSDPSTADIRDSYLNKRLELSGDLLALLFEDLFRRFNNGLRRIAQRSLSKVSRVGIFDVSKTIRTQTITQGLTHAISSGNWNIDRFRIRRVGISQILSRESYLSIIGHLTRINSSFEKSLKLAGPRQLHPSQFGFICPSDTPEGESCGLVKALALTTSITIQIPSKPIERIVRMLGVQDIHSIAHEEIHDYTIVMINGVFIGIHSNPHEFMNQFRKLRRKGYIHSHVSISLHNDIVMISSEGGRVIRPLIIVENGLLDFNLIKGRTLEQLSRKGIIEYVDPNEQTACRIALSKEDFIQGVSTHMEIDPISVLGIVAGLIPFPNHNQSPRNTYQCSMGKQSIGFQAENYLLRTDTNLNILVYPQKALSSTKVAPLVNFGKLPAGYNAILAVMSYSGYDIEDAIILNKHSLDYGFGRCIVYRNYEMAIQHYPNETYDTIKGPSPQDLRRGIKFDLLDEDGMCSPGSIVFPGQVLFNKYVPQNTTDTYSAVEQVEHSQNPIYYKGHKGVIDRVIVTHNDKTQLLAKAIVRTTRRPEVGDKFSSRHGQKGVCGLIVPREDLPFTINGMVPDIIMNPHGFPSRMTVGKIIELLAGKTSAIYGELEDVSAFTKGRTKYFMKSLIEAGYSYSGKDVLYSGKTGLPLHGYIFFGPVYYQKLKHMVMDKIHARSRGPRAVLTRQPTEGRRRGGGLRLGEMERDCLLGYGASLLVQERLMISSDVFPTSICIKCGNIGRKGICKYCETGEGMTIINLPYAFKLLINELMAMGIRAKLEVTSTT